MAKSKTIDCPLESRGLARCSSLYKALSSYQSQFPVLIVYEQILAASTSSSTTLNQYMYMHMCTSERCRAADGAQ